MNDTFRPRKRLGQNFLVRPEIAADIAGYADLGATDTVVEIGGGTGVLTAELVRRAGRVIVFELDRRLADGLEERFAGAGNLEVVAGDFLAAAAGRLAALPSFKVVANPPYYITTPIIFRCLEFLPALRLMVLTVQREVARRLAAAPGTRECGALTMSVGAFMAVGILRSLGPGAFRPAPGVASAVVRFLPRQETALNDTERKVLVSLARAVFCQRRKTIENSLAAALAVSRPVAAAMLAACAIDPRARPEKLTRAQFIALAKRTIAYQR